jgi:rubrerythrin
MHSPLNAVTIDDVVAIAESFEASAAELYRQAAGESDRPEVRQTLLGLAEMEDGHLRALAELRRLLAGRPRAGEVDGREAELLEAWLGRDVFPRGGSPSEGAHREQTVQGWLETAVAMEKESIAFYSGMRSLLAERHRGMLDAIIEEEVYHLASLSYLLRTLRLGQRPILPS